MDTKSLDRSGVDVNCVHQWKLVAEMKSILLPTGYRLEICDICQALKKTELGNNQQSLCTHPDAEYVGDESGVSCSKRRYTRERWRCPDCGASWFEAVRWLD